jgi:hypothetical protein
MERAEACSLPQQRLYLLVFCIHRIGVVEVAYRGKRDHLTTTSPPQLFRALLSRCLIPFTITVVLLLPHFGRRLDARLTRRDSLRAVPLLTECQSSQGNKRQLTTDPNRPRKHQHPSITRPPGHCTPRPTRPRRCRSITPTTTAIHPRAAPPYIRATRRLPHTTTRPRTMVTAA